MRTNKEGLETDYLLSRAEEPSASGANTSADANSKDGWTMRKIALELSLWANIFITLTKLVCYIQTLSLSVLAALLDSVLDVLSQLILYYTEKHSNIQSSALYPAGASRLEPIGVLTCAALMGMGSFEVLKESCSTLVQKDSTLEEMTLRQGISSSVSMLSVVAIKLLLLYLCTLASKKRSSSNSAGVQCSDPTLEAVSLDHLNDALSNGVSTIALLLALYSKKLWWVDSIGAIVISLYIICSWFHTGKEQIEQLTGKTAPPDLIEEYILLSENFDGRLQVDTCRAYHFGPKFLVELEIVMCEHTLLRESHDLGMDLQYEIEAREEVERCFVHIDYQNRDYDEHIVSKVPELRDVLKQRSTSVKSAMSV